MNKLLLLSFCLLAAIHSQAGNGENSVSYKTVAAGHTPNGEITVTQFDLPMDIAQINIDSENNTALLMLRNVNRYGRYAGGGELGLFDCTTGKFSWKVPTKDFRIQKTKDAVVCNDGDQIFRLADGKEITTAAEHEFIFTDYGHNIGYDGTAGYDLTTGARLWEHPIKTPEKTGAENIKVINDSMIAFAYSGLHVLNVKNGKGWDYEMVTSKTGISGLGGEMNMLPGVPVMAGGGSILKTGIISDIGYDTARFYLADWMGLICWDAATGKVLWENEIETKMMSRSHIAIKGDIVYLLNMGAVSADYKEEVNAGTTSFLAAYDKTSGTPLFFDTLGKKSILHAQFKNGNTCWAYNGNFHDINLANGKYQTVHIRAKDAPATNARLLSRDQIFFEGKNGIIESLAEGHAAYFALQDVTSGIVRTYNTDGDVLQTLQPADYWQFKQEYQDMIVLSNFDGQLIFMKNRRELLKTEPAKSNDIYADKLYRVVDKGLQVLSLPVALN